MTPEEEVVVLRGERDRLVTALRELVEHEDSAYLAAFPSEIRRRARAVLAGLQDEHSSASRAPLVPSDAYPAERR